MILIPVFLVFLVVPAIGEALGDFWTRFIAAFVFSVSAITDMFDGKIARKRNLITNFGKFMDPLADKMLVLSAVLGLLVYQEETRPYLIWAAVILVFRELAVTGIRLVVVENQGPVIAASWLGKVKTVTQITCCLTMMLEPAFFGWIPFFAQYRPLSYLTMAAMTVMTLWSGIDYFVQYKPYVNPKH